MRQTNNPRVPNALPECHLLPAAGSISVERPLSTGRRAPTALVVAARPYASELRQALDQSSIHVLAAEFERTVFLAVEHQPDLILVASPPIRDALKTCQRLLENRSTRDIPISLISLDCNMVDEASTKGRTLATAGEFPDRLTARERKGRFTGVNNQLAVDGQRQKQLLSVLDLLRYLETEISELELETSAVLLGAAIADVAQKLKL